MFRIMCVNNYLKYKVQTGAGFKRFGIITFLLPDANLSFVSRRFSLSYALSFAEE